MFAKLQIEIYFRDFFTCTRMVFTSKSPLSQKDSTDMFGKLSASASLIPPDPNYPLETVVEVYSRNELGNHLSPKVKPGQNIMPILMQDLTNNSHIKTEEPSDKWFRLIIPLEVDKLIQSSKTKGSDQNCEIEITLHPDLSQSELYTHMSSATYHCTQVCQKEDKEAVRQPKFSVSMVSGTKDFRHFHFFFKSNFSEAESKSSKMYVSQLENTKLPGIRAVSVFFRSVCLSAVAELP